jgi:hypothetical protein
MRQPRLLWPGPEVGGRRCAERPSAGRRPYRADGGKQQCYRSSWTTFGRTSHPYCHLLGPAPRGAVRLSRTGRRSPASCSCSRRDCRGSICQPRWGAAPACPAGGGCMNGSRRVSGPLCTERCWSIWNEQGSWTGAALRWTASALRPKRGACDGAEPHGPWQAGHEAPPRRGRTWNAARRHADRGQPA